MNQRIVHPIAVAISLVFSAGAMAQGLSKADYKSAKAACGSLSGNAKDVCIAEAKGKEEIARAELDARYAPSDENRYAVEVAKAKADYWVAKEKCDERSGKQKAACVNEAKAAETQAVANARMQLKSARADAPAKGGAVVAGSKGGPGEYVEDSLISAKVKAAVLGEPSLQSAEIHVETTKGVVQLSGFVRSKADLVRAAEIARGVKDVKSVKNEIVVKGQP